MAVPLVEMRGITKVFPGVVANDGVNLSIQAGEIHALLGENGAGKSTLMSILTGLYRPDGGEIYIDGQRVNFRSPRDAIAAGIGMVHQHFRLVAPFTVTENVALGLKGGLRLNLNKLAGEIAALSKEYGLQVDPQARIWQLSVGEQQRVEIIKLLYRHARVLILDEPTAVLTPQEARDLYQTLKKMAARGCAVIFITHKLQEVMDAADTITILRGGKTVATVKKSETNEKELARMMVGREILWQVSKPAGRKGDKVLEIKNLKALNDKGLPALKGINLAVYAGEILGIAGVAGNGQRELAEVIAGLRPCQEGTITVAGQELGQCDPCRVINAGVGYIPEDRLGMGLVPNLGAVDNLLLKEYRHPRWGRAFLNRQAAREWARELVERFQVKTAGLNAPVKMMSGGNLQRLLLAREISNRPRLLVAVYPARGLDVGATETVHRLLLEQRAAGTAILLISEDLEELFRLADRIAVMYEGEITGLMAAGEARIEELGLMMAGAKRMEVSA
ncbi:MAG: ral nucleoside transport system ATP-binding protein [Moorella sp. (in: firmicutes)]|uniref:ABC transporter ATP-binding protein n=1 Tax=Moorella sp. E306M TaxID=2572683 RepID=UPI0010FFB392|nr:ABC transporter ATP-binding protein [Moorella sp. E306M]MDK2815896.1 ral nucleoside transport system ATP-binding protein [Moorella sp. (in: firmicutes)]MDK2894599.1 ral nucleoside transport system ATP-binding protein [Moorella sp. (in: firmicutes)]GEA18728.1 ABC transporter [Moorella sp. E306M]